MKNFTILLFSLMLFVSCSKDDEGSGPTDSSSLLKFTLEDVEYVKTVKMPGELAYYGKYGKDDTENFVVNISGALNYGATVVFILSTDKTSDILHYSESNISHLHNFTIVFEKPGGPEDIIYYAYDDITVTISERILPTNSENGKIKGTFSGTFIPSIDNVKQEGKRTFISGNFNVGY